MEGTAEERLRWLCDRAEVVDTVLRFALALDTHDWAMLRGCLADAVEVDYSAFRNEPPGTLPADEFVRRRITGLSQLRMQHVSTNHLVEIDGHAATCRSCYLIHRVHTGLPAGENTLDTAGHYVHRLARTPDGWRIAGIVQTVLWSRGNPRVHGVLRPSDAKSA
jgi:SnoaL-like domain